MPKYIRKVPAIRLSQNRAFKRQSEMSVSPDNRMLAKITWAVAAPSPEIKPESFPKFKVLFMQMIPICPIGAAIEKLIIAPVIKKSRNIFFWYLDGRCNFNTLGYFGQ